MKVKLIKIFYILLTLLLTTVVFADNDDSPVDMLRKVSTCAIDQLNTSKEKVGKDKDVPLQTIRHIVNTCLLPHIAFDDMSRRVVGTNTWKRASASQKEKFKQEFTNLVIDTYSSGLKTFDKRRIKFPPIRGGYKGKTFVQVNSRIDSRGGEPLSVVYSLERNNGQWLVYDISVDGVSLLQSYRVQFATVIENKGFNGLLTMLASRNKVLSAQQHRKVVGS